MNKILNGDFSSGFDYWTNPSGGLAFNLVAGQAQGVAPKLKKTYKMCQQFSSDDEIITAKITVWAAWETYVADDVDGYSRFIVELEKPNTTIIELKDITYTGVINAGNILDDVNIKEHMATYGNYKLWITLETQAAITWLEGPDEYTTSYGAYDNISIDATVKKTKSVHEKMGGSGLSHLSRQMTSQSESAKLTERYNVKVSKTVAEIIGLSESCDTAVREAQFKTVAESVGLVEAYSKQQTLHRASVEAVGLSEAIQAKRTQGNIITTFDISDLTDWNETDGVTTPWIKYKTEIG